MSKTSHARYIADSEEARSAVYDNPNGTNPFDEGDRKYRFWNKWKRTYDHCEYVIDLMGG